MIREYVSQDLSAVVDLFERSVRESASRDYSAAQIAAWAPQNADMSAWAKRLSKGVTLVCMREDRIAGFIRMENNEHLDLLYVHPQHQRQGIARALFQRALAWALGQGASRLTSEVSVTARPFFERMGFRVIESQTVERQGVSLLNFKMVLDISAQQSAGTDANSGRRSA
ncbi:MAG TPA: GNAT family N-acetyltransferase [Alphaproteobacteria bacterium]|nr:GNAT family N-acetyltransferase [Alphaproteobacteria bacterium]